MWHKQIHGAPRLSPELWYRVKYRGADIYSVQVRRRRMFSRTLGEHWTFIGIDSVPQAALYAYNRAMVELDRNQARREAFKWM